MEPGAALPAPPPSEPSEPTPDAKARKMPGRGEIYWCNERMRTVLVDAGAEAVRDQVTPGRIAHKRIPPIHLLFRDGECDLNRESERLHKPVAHLRIMLEETQIFKDGRVWDHVANMNRVMLWLRDLEPPPTGPAQRNINLPPGEVARMQDLGIMPGGVVHTAGMDTGVSHEVRRARGDQGR
jgi:hypothetical protein